MFDVFAKSRAHRAGWLAALSVSALALTSAVSQAADVTIRGIDDEIALTGQLIKVDDTYFHLRTPMGDLSIARDRATCEGATCPEAAPDIDTLTVAGASAVAERLLPELLATYAESMDAAFTQTAAGAGGMSYRVEMAEGTDLQMDVRGTTTADGLRKLIAGQVGLSIAQRTANEAEEALATEAGFGPIRVDGQEQLLAYDGLLVVTHPKNPIRAVPEETVAKIFAGEIRDWSELGGPAGPIKIYLREADSSSRALLDDVLMKAHREAVMDGVTILASDSEIARAVRENPNAIGLTSFVHRAGVNTLEIEGVCGIRVPATEFTIKTGEYPLSRPVFLYSGAPMPDASPRASFSAFLASDAAQSVIRRVGFVDRAIQSEPLNTQGLRVTHAVMRDEAATDMEGTKRMLQLMSNAKRLSTTIRFPNGSTDLDTADYAELEQLAALIASDEYAGTEFYFMGFSDSIGRADLNQFLALQRAEIVRQALVSRYPELAGRIQAHSVGYGELSPLACNETRAGRNVNRRVEVWVHNPAAMATLAKAN